jgi:hypothetical protein
MSRTIIKIEDYYLDWSSVTDSPITFGVNIDEFMKYYERKYGEKYIKDELPLRMEIVEKYGHSAYNYFHESLEDFVKCNRAGPDETELTLDEIYKAFCLREPIRDGWLAE